MLHGTQENDRIELTLCTCSGRAARLGGSGGTGGGMFDHLGINYPLVYLWAGVGGDKALY